MQTVEKLKKLLAEEQAARLKAEKISQEATKRSGKEIDRLRANLERAKKDAEEFRMRAESKKMCVYLWNLIGRFHGCICLVVFG